MKITRTTKKAVPPPPQVAELIHNLLQAVTDNIPQVLCQIDVWKWPRSDLNAWIKVLNKFDTVLEEIIRDHDVEKLQLHDFSPSTKRILCAILRFERLLLENSTNRKMYNSYDRLNHLLACSDLDIVVLALNVLLRPAQQYSAQASVGHALNISTPRLQSLAKKWPHLREYGIGLVDLARQNGSAEVDALPSEAREVNFSFYKTDVDASGATDKEKEAEKLKKMESDPANASQSSPRKASTTPITFSSTAINVHIDEQEIFSKSVMNVLADTIEANSVPDDEKFELMCRIRAAKALTKEKEADRVKLVVIRLLAIAIFGHTHVETQASTSLFMYEPDLITNIAELLQIDNDVNVRVQTAAIAALDSLARYRSKNQEVLTAVNAGVNHGILMALLRKTIADVADPDSTLPQSFTDALLSFVTFIASHSSGGNMVVGAGLIPLLIQVIDNKLPNRLLILSKTMQLVDNVLYGFGNAFNMFCTARGVEALVNRIEHEVDLAISEISIATRPHVSISPLGELPIARSAALKHILRSMHRMMQSSGTAEGLRGLIDMSLLKSIKKIIEYRGLFGPTVLPLAINIMATFVHNEPTSLSIIQEARLPEVFYNTIEAGLEPAIEVIQAVANAVGALCLNEVGQVQLAHRPSIIPAILSVFTSERHLKVLLDKENAVLVGTAIDELIRHHPSLKMAVFDALKSTIIKIEALGQTFDIPRESRQWYFLVPAVPSGAFVDTDVVMEDVGAAPVASTSLVVAEEEAGLHDNEDDSQPPKPHDNTIVSFIDAFGRFLEGLFQHTPHCRDFVTMADGLTLLGRLTSLPCLPYDFANSVASDSMVQVMRTMTEVVTDETLSSLAKLVKQSLDDTRHFWENVHESSKLLPLVDISAEEEQAANHRFRDLVTLHIRVTLLSDVFSTAGYAHGRAAIGLLQTLMVNVSSEGIHDLGALHRATIWENIILNVGLSSKGIELKATPPASPLNRSPNQSSVNLPDGDNTANVITDPIQIEAEATTGMASGDVHPKLGGPRHQNSLALKHITHGIPSALAPFFQAIVKMFNVRRNLDLSQKRQIFESSRILAEVMVRHLSIPSFSDIPSRYGYYTVMLGFYAILLVDERTSTHNLHTVQLFHLYRANGFDAILNVCQEFAKTMERVIKVKEEDITEAEKKELDYAYGGLKVALHLLRPLISSKPIHDSGQTAVLLTRDKKDTDPDYFEPHNFLVKMRTALLSLLQGLWEAPWLLSAPLSVTKSIAKLILEIVNDEGEESKGDSTANDAHPTVNTLMRPPENRVQLLTDMGFPRSAAERALVRTGNNLNAATDLLLSHPFPLPPDPEPEPESEPEPEEPTATEPEPTIAQEDASPVPSGAVDDSAVASPLVAATDDGQAFAIIGKPADQWKRELDEARMPLRAGLSRQALLLIDEHVSLLFELHVVFVRPNNAYRQQAVQELVDDVESFSPYAYDVQEQPLANRCRLIALILSESPSLLSSEMKNVLMRSLLALLLSCVKHPDHPPRWLATHLLVTEALFTLAAEPRVITLPKEGEPIISQTISVGPPLTEAKSTVFEFCLRLLDTPNLPGDEFLAILRLFVFLTRDREMASQFLQRDGIPILLKRAKESAVFGSSAYIVTILRHLVEDEQTIRQIMHHTIKRYFSQPRTRTVDVSTYVRNCSALALRNPEIFLAATSSLCELGQPFTSPNISLKGKPPLNHDIQAQQIDSPVDMQVDPPTTTATQSSASIATVETLTHALVGELMSTMKALNESPSQSVDQDAAATSSQNGSSDQARRQSAPNQEGSSQESNTNLNDYVSFIMQCLTELLFSYDSCKLAFLSYSPKKRNQTPAKETSKYRTATLHFLLNDLVAFGTINPQPDDRARNRITLCNWAMSVIVALCVDSTPNHEVKEVSSDLVSVRKFVLEAVSRAIKDPSTSENVEARYGRLLALADLCHRLLTVKFSAASRKQTDDNPTHIAKIMLEKNFVATLTTALSEIDLNYPNIRGLVPSILRPLEYLTKIAIKMSRTSAKHKESVEGAKTESESSFTSDEEDEDLEEEDREETPDLYRNSALGMYAGEMEDAHFNADGDMDEDDEDEDEDVEMEFAEETGSDDTSNTDEEPEDDVEDETRNPGEVWDDGEDDDLVENDEEDEEDEANEDDVQHLGGDYDGDDVVWQDTRGGDVVRLGGGHMDEDEEPHMVPIQIIHEEENIDDNMGSDEEDYVADHGVVAGEEAFGFGDAFVNTSGREGGGGVFISRRREAGNDNIQVFGRTRTNNPTPPTTHPLLLDTSASQQRPPANQSRGSRHAQRILPSGSAELLQTIDDLIGGGAVQLFQHIMSRGRIPGGSETMRLDVPTGAVVNLGRGFIQRRAPPFSASIRVESQHNTHDDRVGRELEPLLTSQRWAQEVKILNGEFVPERLGKFANHVILTLLPAAVEAIKQAKIMEEQEAARRREAETTAAAEDKAAAPSGETLPAEAPKASVLEVVGSPAMEAHDHSMEDVPSVDRETTDHDGVDTTMDVEHQDPIAGSSVEGTQAESSASPTTPRVTVMIHGSAVDITETGIDPTFLEALPDDMREEVLNQHVREQRAARVERPADSQISSEFLDALPPEIRAEIIQQEAMQRAQTRTGAPTDMDNASFIASLDPILRQTVLMEQDDGFIQTLPSHMLAEVGAYRENQQQHRIARSAARVPAGGSTTIRKPAMPHDAIQLLDKTGVAVLVRLLFFPHVLKKSLLFKVLVNLCENARTRTELFNLLLSILQDGTGDLATVDKSFSQMSFKNSKLPPSKAGKQKAGAEYPTTLSNPTTPNETVSDLVAQRCLEALTYIVGANELSSLFFLTEHEMPAGLRRSASKKGKAKEKQLSQTHYPVVLLLSLLDRQSLLRTPTIMESVVGLLATVTRPLASLKDPMKLKELEASISAPDGTVPPDLPSSSSTSMEVGEAIEGTLASDMEHAAPTITTVTSEPPAEASLQVPTPPKESIEAVEEKILLANPPQIPHAVLRLIVNILAVGECSGRTFQQSLALIQHLSYIPDARDVIAQELKSKAQEAGQNLSSDLDDLAIALESPEGDLLVSSVAAKFSPASSVQAKLLRVLKTIDYMYTPKLPTSSEVNSSDDVKKVQSIYESFQFSGLWRRLGSCLSVIEENPSTEHIATVLLPLIEALMVVCKYVGPTGSSVSRVLRSSASPRSPGAGESMEDLFVTFTDAHRKILNLMVRNNPSLMSGSFSLLVHNPRVLDFDNKRNYFNQQLHRRPPTREHYNTLQLNVRRARVFEDSFQHLQRKTGDQIKYGKLSVRFYDEEGVDAGGVTREWFQILARQMFDPNNALFQPCAADKLTYQPNKNSWVNPEHLSFFKFVGRVIGKAIYDGRLLDAYFARSLYRQLLGKPVDYKDVEWVDPEYYNSLCWILENDPTVLDLTFSVEADEFGVNKIVPLKEGGETTYVTQDNKREFVQLSAQYRLSSSIEKQIENLLSGFYEIIPKDLVTIFNEQELELLISGTPDIDVDEWRAATEYNGYTSSDPNIVWWWRALKSFNRDERAKVLSFATGTSRVPLNGFVDLQGVQGVQRFSIHKAYGASDRLPQAHTCFNQIDLPQYTSYEMLRQQLLLAINEGGEGFAFS